MRTRTDFTDKSGSKRLLKWLKKKGVKRSFHDNCYSTWKKTAGIPESNFLHPPEFANRSSIVVAQKRGKANSEPEGLQKKPKNSGEDSVIAIGSVHAGQTA